MNKPADSWMILKKWFPDLSDETWEKLKQYTELLREWNAKINLVSRKDMDRLETKHLAHCLTLTKFLRLMPKARLLDVGTGGGLPGIPMAICYPQAKVYSDGFDRKKNHGGRRYGQSSGTFQHGGSSRSGGGIAQEKIL
jgi:16S rRNA (guanine527-N7)-methyltransferase